MSRKLKIKIAGVSCKDDFLIVESINSSCGNSDGIAVQFESEQDKGPWVIDLKSLKRVIAMAERDRKED